MKKLFLSILIFILTLNTLGLFACVGEDDSGEHTHAYAKVITPPTCMAQGYTTFACACGDSYKADYTDMVAHKFVNGVCSVCNKNENTAGETPDNQEHTHNYNSEITAPTCIEQGYTVYTCACGDSYQNDYIPALGHEFINYVSNNDATEDTDGTATASCSRSGCNEKDTKIDIGSRLNHTHNFIKGETVEPTCTERGYTIYSCKCGNVYNDNYQNPTNHDGALENIKVTKQVSQSEGGTLGGYCNACQKDISLVQLPSLNSVWENYYTKSIASANESYHIVKYLYNYKGVDYNVVDDNFKGYHLDKNITDYSKEKYPNLMMIAGKTVTCDEMGENNMAYMCPDCNVYYLVNVMKEHVLSINKNSITPSTTGSLTGTMRVTCSAENCKHNTANGTQVDYTLVLDRKYNCIDYKSGKFNSDKYNFTLDSKDFEIVIKIAYDTHKLNGEKVNEGDTFIVGTKNIVLLSEVNCLQQGMGYFMCEDCKLGVECKIIIDCNEPEQGEKVVVFDDFGNMFWVCQDCGKHHLEGTAS